MSNFVSGIILLLERSIKPGDVIEVGSTTAWSPTLGRAVEVASQRVTLGEVLARRRPPTASPVECPNRTTAIGPAMAPVSKNFGPQNCGAMFVQDKCAARMIEDYYDFPMLRAAWSWLKQTI